MQTELSPRILAFAGSARKDSYNKKLIRIAAEGARLAGARVTLLDLRELPMPLFDEDLEREQGMPANARTFKGLLREHDGWLIASPEYNSSLPPLLKNALDWASRREGDEAPLAVFDGKVAGLVSASPGALGGLRGLVHLRSMLGNIRVLVIPDQVAVPRAHEALLPDGSLKDTQQQAAVQRVGARLVEVATRLRG